MKVQTKDEVIKKLQAHIKEIEDFGIEKFGIFGSFVRNENITDESDVDILVSFQPGCKTFDNFMGLLFFLENLLDRSVDLITVESLSPYIGPKILTEVEYVLLGY